MILEQKKAAGKILGFPGKMISSSKSGYISKNPENLVVFNSNVCTEEGKIWHGDLDVTLSYGSHSEMSRETGQTIYVLREMDGRFEYESNPQIDRAIIKFFPEGDHEMDGSLNSSRIFNIKPIK
jgi:hypothetical protein